MFGEIFVVGFQLGNLLPQQTVFIEQMSLLLVLNHQRRGHAGHGERAEAKFQLSGSHNF
jgi:hypothetical protein